MWHNSPRIWTRILPRVASLPTDVAPKQSSLSCTWGLRTPASLSVSPRNQPRSLLPPPCGGPLGSPSWSKEQSRSAPRRYASNSCAHQSSGALIQRVERLPLLDDEPVQGPSFMSETKNIFGFKRSGHYRPPGMVQGRRDEDSGATSKRAPTGVCCCRQTPCPGVATSVTLVAGNIAVVR